MREEISCQGALYQVSSVFNTLVILTRINATQNDRPNPLYFREQSFLRSHPTQDLVHYLFIDRFLSHSAALWNFERVVATFDHV